MLEPLLKYGFDGGIASCGGFVFCGDEVIYDCPLTEDQRAGVMKLFSENGVFIECEAKDAAYCDQGPENFSGKNRELQNMINAVWIDLGPDPMSKYDGRPIYKMVFIGPSAESIDPAVEALGEELSFILHDFSEPDCVFGEIVNRKFNKGSAARLVAEKLGYDMADTIGIGDSMIDLELLDLTGTSVCMASGPAKLKELSDLVCPGVDDDGIEWAFKELGLV